MIVVPVQVIRMKRLLSFLITILTANLLFAQTENYRITMQSFQANYNAEKYDEVFHSFSPEMKQVLSIENTKEFLSNLKNQVGKIKSKEFINYQKETYATYKTYFENAVLSVNISLDDKNQINGLLIEPYHKPQEAESNTVNALNDYPKEIAEIIFSKSKNFPNNIQLSIALIQHGKTSYYGIIKKNDTIKPIENQEKIFEIGSITKVFTSTVLATLVVNKKIRLTNYINSYYPFTFKDNIRISFESLANHTSGLPRLPENLDLSDESNPYKQYGKNQIEDYLNNFLKLENQSSLIYSYSNLGAGLLGYTLGLSQKTTFQRLLQKKVFDKYEMSNSFTNSESLGNKPVEGRNQEGEIVPNWDFDVLFGGGGILSTTKDLAKFANAQFSSENKELELTRIPTFEIDNTMKIGLGWHILKSDTGNDLFFHNGGTGGYSSSMIVNTDSKTAAIILSNVSAFDSKMGNIEKLCFELINKMEK